MKHVWETKTNASLGTFQAGGITVYGQPLLIVSPPNEMPILPKPEDIIIFTSGNGVRAFCELTDRRHWPVLSVGDATAQMAQAYGFENVLSADGDVKALRKLITSQSALKSKRLYYACGQDISGNLTGDLKQEGFNITRAILYETHPIKEVPAYIQSAISREFPFTVTLFSAKGARAFRALNLDFSRIETVSISEKVDEELNGLGLINRKTAEKPTELSMIKLLR